jgi:hypothetical protein
MSTALLYCGIPEGFVIGTDSRAVNKLIGQSETDCERKIFAFENSLASIVFAWAGSVKIIGSSFGTVSLVTETYDSLSRLPFKSLFADDLAIDLKKKLSIFTVNTSGRMAVGIFLSFLKGSPWVSQITVSKNGRTFDCSVEEGPACGDIDIVSGPGCSFDKPVSLEQAKDSIERYIKGCIDDPRNEDIGGEVHIGKFTSEGFDWMVPPSNSKT